MNPNGCLCGALGAGLEALEAFHQNPFHAQAFYGNHDIIEIKLEGRSITCAPSNFGLLVYQGLSWMG
ncbi:hypothetical protein ACFX1X_046762 [Malus domestica]